MRTVEEVENYLIKKNGAGSPSVFRVSTKTESGSSSDLVSFYSLKGAINGCVIKLWNDEDITEAFIFNENRSTKIPVLLVLTNRRLFISRESFSTSEGFIFTSTNYFYKLEVTELEYIDLNKCRILEQKNESFFGKPKPSIWGNLIVDDKNALVTVNLKVLEDVYKAVIKNIKALTEKTAPKAEVNIGYNPNGASISQNAGNAGTVENSGNVAEIRKLYEDGIITREEMLDLIKSIVSK